MPKYIAILATDDTEIRWIKSSRRDAYFGSNAEAMASAGWQAMADAAAGTPAARDLLARPRRFERPTSAAGASPNIQSSEIQQNQARCRLPGIRLFRPLGARSSAG